MTTGCQLTSSSVSVELLDALMNRSNAEGLNLLEAAIFVLFSTADDRFLIYLIENMPNIKKYLHNCNDEGWLPLFRILHLFQRKLKDNEGQSVEDPKQIERTEKLLDALF